MYIQYRVAAVADHKHRSTASVVSSIFGAIFINNVKLPVLYDGN